MTNKMLYKCLCSLYRYGLCDTTPDDFNHYVDWYLSFDLNSREEAMILKIMAH
jgi:hypothetical protein